MPVHIIPTRNATDLLEFVKQCCQWREGVARVVSSVGEIKIRGGAVVEG